MSPPNSTGHKPRLKPTTSQLHAIHDIRRDLHGLRASKRPFIRIVYGEVGSGKTLVAQQVTKYNGTLGHQSAVMSPTEAVAEQTLLKFVQYGSDPSKLAILTSSTPARARRLTLQRIRDGTVDTAIGTSALLSDDVLFKHLTLAIIDEQQRFGVEQRATLRDKGSHTGVVQLTATPIPRTLSASKRSHIKTSHLTTHTRSNRVTTKTSLDLKGWRHVTRKVNATTRSRNNAFFVFPKIEPATDTGPPQYTDDSLQNGLRILEKLTADHVIIIDVTGKMKPTDKQQAIAKFRDTPGSVLAATTVIEVGLDVSDANLMVIVNPNALGLAQIHQLRGRVGRDGRPAECILMIPADDQNQSRINQITLQTSGANLSTYDMGVRGPGNRFGTAQKGAPEDYTEDTYDSGFLDI